jgi:hypothetical protein
VNYPPPEELVEQCGKMQLLDKLLKKLRAGGHKVLIFSQVSRGLIRGARKCDHLYTVAQDVTGSVGSTTLS